MYMYDTIKSHSNSNSSTTYLLIDLTVLQ